MRFYGERWKRIPETIDASCNNGYCSKVTYHPCQYYEVSDRGRVRNKLTKHIMSVRDNHGSSVVTIYGRYERHLMSENWKTKDKQSMTLSVARLVAATFIYGNHFKAWYVVKHLDGNSHNNSLDNLDIKY